MFGGVVDFLKYVWWALVGLRLTLIELELWLRFKLWSTGKPHNEEILAAKSLNESGNKLGYTCVITGSNSGVGLETARHLSSIGYQVILACRSKERAEEAIKDIKKSNSDKKVNIIFIPLDLADLNSVRSFVDQVSKIKNLKLDLLINNAGLMWVNKGFTKQGIELHFGVNHVGHFLLTNLLLPLMHEPGRILVLTSETYRIGEIPFNDLKYDKYYSPFYAYCNSKLATLHFAYSLAEKLKNSGKKISVYCINPGTAKTNIVQELPRIFKLLYSVIPSFMLRNSYQAACCSLYAALSKDVEGKTGLYLSECVVKEPEKNSNAYNLTERNKLWTVSEQLTNSKFPW